MIYDQLDGPRSSRNHYVDPPSLFERACSVIVPVIERSTTRTKALTTSNGGLSKRNWREEDNALRKRMVNVTFGVQLVLITVWLFLLRWGERTVFQSSLNRCSWGNWEKWVSYRDRPCCAFR